MPRYKLTDPQTGMVFHLTGDAPPTEAEATEAFQGAALEKSLKRRGFSQQPPPEEFLSKFRNMGSLLKGAAQTPGGAAMMAAPLGATSVGVNAMNAFPKLALRAATLPIVDATAGAYGGYKRGGIPGAIIGGLSGAAVGRGVGALTRMADAAKAAKTAAAVAEEAAPMMKAARPLILSPADAAVAAQKAKLAFMEAQQQGMKYAAYGRKGMP